MNTFLSGLIFLIFGLPVFVLAVVLVIAFCMWAGWWLLVIPAVLGFLVLIGHNMDA